MLIYIFKLKKSLIYKHLRHILTLCINIVNITVSALNVIVKILIFSRLIKKKKICIKN